MVLSSPTHWHSSVGPEGWAGGRVGGVPHRRARQKGRGKGQGKVLAVLVFFLVSLFLVRKIRRKSKREPKGMSSQERAEHHRIFLKNDPMGYSYSCSANLDLSSIEKQLDNISIPVLLVYGELDTKEKQTISNNFPSNFEKIIVSGAGNYVHLDKPESIEHLIYDFTAKHNLQFNIKDIGENQ